MPGRRSPGSTVGLTERRTAGPAELRRRRRRRTATLASGPRDAQPFGLHVRLPLVLDWSNGRNPRPALRVEPDPLGGKLLTPRQPAETDLCQGRLVRAAFQSYASNTIDQKDDLAHPPSDVGHSDGGWNRGLTRIRCAPMEATRAEGAPRSQSAAELKRLIELDREASPYLVLRDGDDQQVEIALEPDRGLVVGRGQECDLSLRWDSVASRIHGELVCRGGAWLVLDDGISKNGTFVNGERVHGRRRLQDGDVIVFGSTPVRFRWPKLETETGTLASTAQVTAAQVSPGQRKVLVALCRPYGTASDRGIPATNRQIAEELFLSDEAVKSHLRALFHRFGIEDLPQNAKRVRLAQLAIRAGIVTPRDSA